MSFSAYSEYKSSRVELFEKVPSRWSIQRLKQVVNPSRPITYGIVQAGENVPDGIPYIRPADMTDESGVKAEDTLLRTSPEIANSYKRSSIVAGDIVCSIGPSFGKLMMVPSSLEGSNLTQGTARVAVSQDHMPRFLFWALKSVESYQQWESSVGGATFRALNLGPLAETFICVPSPAEQTQIARFLDHETARIDALITEQHCLIELLKEKRQTVISHAVTKGLDSTVPMKESGVDWLGEVPAHWAVSPLKFLVEEKVAGPYGASLTKAMYTDSGYRVYGQQQVISNDFAIGDYYISEEKFSEMQRYVVFPGDVLVSVMGTIGRVSVVPIGVEVGIINPRLVRYKFASSKVIPEFVRLLLMSLRYQSRLREESQGSTMEGLNMVILGDLPLVTPPLDTQCSIVAFIKNYDSIFNELVSQATSAVDLLQERRSALISAAVTGKIDVRGWQPPASVPTPQLAQEAV